MTNNTPQQVVRGATPIPFLPQERIAEPAPRTGLSSKITLWRIIVGVIFAAGAYAAYARFGLGLGPSTHLVDAQPWGLWVGLGTLCGVGLSAGGFAIAASVYLLGFDRYRPVLRTAVLVSFLGYMSVVVGMMYELGLPWRIWHPIVMWNRHSVLFEVAWCVMLYTTVLALEFSPALVEKIPFTKVRDLYLKWQHEILIGLVLVGTVLSSMHQSFLGGLYLLTKGKLDPLWYSPYLPTLFYLSAIPAGLAVTIMALYLSARSLNVRVDFSILNDVSRVIAPMLLIYALFRAVDLFTHGGSAYMWKWREETLSFWLEIGLFVLAPVVLLSRERVRNHPQHLYWTCSLIVMGFVANRLNVSITGLQASSGFYYVPKWTEFALTLATITAAVLAFRYAVIYLDILPKNNSGQRWISSSVAEA
ncbi:MAG TPA: NrfD/PsrC family molybdoenzyme membrane anchor subunit [Terriglobales bacterium]|nr:NrfD/PsrC family molybdoenzyme membrane anchor subunit [Terriglobales bacterium]